MCSVPVSNARVRRVFVHDIVQYLDAVTLMHAQQIRKRYREIM